MDEKDYQAIAAALAPVIKAQIAAATAPLEAQIKELAGRAPLQGEPGPAGKDGPSDETVAEAIADMVARAVAALPPPAAGADGRDGRDADEEAITAKVMASINDKLAQISIPKDGADGKDGKDGVGLADALIDRQGALVVTLTNGTVKSLGLVVGKDGQDGAAGNDGADALGFDDLSIEFDGERDFKFVMVRGEARKEFGPYSMPVVIDRGVWKEGAFKRGDGVTWGGSFFIAQEDTADKPETSKAWRLAVKRGRDGKDGIMKAERPSAPVRIGT